MENEADPANAQVQVAQGTEFKSDPVRVKSKPRGRNGVNGLHATLNVAKEDKIGNGFVPHQERVLGQRLILRHVILAPVQNGWNGPNGANAAPVAAKANRQEPEVAQ